MHDPLRWVKRNVLFSASCCELYLYQMYLFVHLKMFSIKRILQLQHRTMYTIFKTQELWEGYMWPWRQPAVKLFVQVTQRPETLKFSQQTASEKAFFLCAQGIKPLKSSDWMKTQLTPCFIFFVMLTTQRHKAWGSFKKFSASRIFWWH